MLEKWKRAVVHRKCATEITDTFMTVFKRIEEKRAELNQGKISQEQFIEEISGKSRDIRYHGTALFLLHSGRRYLLTARHAVWDKLSAERELEEEVQRGVPWPEKMRPELQQSAIKRTQNRIFNIIFRVPSITEIISTNT